MTPDGSDPPLDLAGTLKGISDQLSLIRKQLDGLQRSRWRLTRWLVVLTALAAVAVAGLTWWNVRQDEVRARNHDENLARVVALEQGLARTQAQNSLFRERICASIGDWREYLKAAPAGPAAGQAAASRLVASLNTLCPKPLPGG